jgi:hypothetical protein
MTSRRFVLPLIFIYKINPGFVPFPERNRKPLLKNKKRDEKKEQTAISGSHRSI